MRSAGRTFATLLPATVLSVAASLCAGCVGEGDQVIVQDPFPASGLSLVERSGGPLDLGTFERVLLSDAASAALGTAQGRLAVGTAEGVWLSHPELLDRLVPFPLRREADEPEATGAVHGVFGRPAGGLLVAAQAGLFHDAEGLLYYSPLSRSLPGPVAQGDVVGDAEGAETLWLLPAEAQDAVWRVSAGQLWPIRVVGLGAEVDGVFALDEQRALLSAAGALHALDLEKGTLRLLLRDLGAVHGAARSPGGALFFATDAGLLERQGDGRFVRHTLSAEGAGHLPARAVFAAEEGVLVATDGALLQLRDGGAVKLSDLEGPADAVAQDASGDAFVADALGVWRHLTGGAVSFAADVQPFLTQHCATCHRAGDGAPVMDLEDYDVARALAPRIRLRLEAQDVSPMPPQSVEILTRADYAVVLRWIAGGMKP